MRPSANCIASSVTASVMALGGAQTASAAVYGGPGLAAGIQAVAGIGGISSSSSITSVVLAAIAFILSLTLLFAVAAIIYGGLYLIFSNGDETQKDKAKTIVIYAVAGVVLILFSRVIIAALNVALGTL